MDSWKDQRGFTLVELLVAMSLIAILVTLGAQPMRNYWLNRAVMGAADDVATQLRSLQERVVSESHPLVYGAAFAPGSADWSLLQYNPSGPSCSVVGTRSFDTDVVVQSASFIGAPAAIVTACSALPGVESDDAFVFFYARGSATGGQVAVRQPTIGRTETVTVGPITGRVDQS